jgi:hypothetical protein
MSQRIYHIQLHAIMYVPKMTKAAIQAAAMNASAQSHMTTLVLWIEFALATQQL